jgi:glycosyltransferase involved in cell wall biosynthesis
MNPKVSIIMPVYNTEKYLERCLNSILNQTYTKWELIAVNDGSTDNSLEILNSYAQKDNRIIVFEQENQGQSVARNKALDIVKGEYICFVDSDDWVELDYLEDLYKAITSTNSEIAMCSFYYSSDNDEKIGYKFKSNIIPLREYKSKLLKDQIRSYLWNCIFKRSLFNNLRFQKNNIYEDMVLFTDLLPRLSKDVIAINKPLYHYYLRDNSTIHQKSIKKAFSHYEAIKYRYNLNYLNLKEKAIFLNRIIDYLSLFYKYEKYEKSMIDDCLKIINSADKIVLAKALKFLSIRELFKFILVFYCPALFRTLFKFYLLFKDKNNKEKSFIDNYEIREI